MKAGFLRINCSADMSMSSSAILQQQQRTEAMATAPSLDTAEHGTFRLSDLPPLPKPNLSEMRSQALCGNLLVLSLITIFCGLTNAIALWGPSAHTGAAWWVVFVAIWGQTAIALVCLLAIMWADPGTVRRSEATCFPVPDAVAEKLRRGESLATIGNITRDGRTYCVRCLVWRPNDGGRSGGRAGSSLTHHCQTCNRCVTEFDHHCGVFGRCIAGKCEFKGNMWAFRLILVMAASGAITCGAAVLSSFAVHGSPYVPGSMPWPPSPPPSPLS